VSGLVFYYMFFFLYPLMLLCMIFGSPVSNITLLFFLYIVFPAALAYIGLTPWGSYILNKVPGFKSMYIINNYTWVSCIAFLIACVFCLVLT
jgi:hypothetical protein